MTLMDITPPSLVELQKQFYNRGVLDERERIINLLVEKENSWGYSQELQWQLVELIKGEQK